ncbi:hypothetical protein CPC08DRAFT_32892 [Agrocybe pediades]|nr:hypothetical protein CPC08DRAFT_32892 [Agrocybe pediades]
MSRKSSPESRIRTMPSPYAQELYRNPYFLQAVNKAADLKCLHAIRTGRLRLAVPTNLPQPLRYTPRMDLIDDPSSSKITAIFEVPGIKPESVNVYIHDGNLIVMGERKSLYFEMQSSPQKDHDTSSEEATQSKKETGVIRVTTPVQELRFGAFHRAIPLPQGTQKEDLTANLIHGMLTVTWPRGSTVPSDQASKPLKQEAGSSPLPLVMSTNTAAGTASQ